ncbi:MAG: rRNA maturation RNase YbeY [Coriobacteriales bacterium]|jgi:probable rRNA maturation factor|nr:rRNA maturation RNase YbeY [Coriobacteriales bacterium]
MSTVSLDNRSGEDLPLDAYEAFACFVLDQFALPVSAELAISLVGVDEIHGLNLQYRGIDAPTDVLSFACDAFDGQGAPDGGGGGSAACCAGEAPCLLGDVIVAPVVAREHARDFDARFEDEMLLMLVHGILHLMGHDHEDDEEAAAMEAHESSLLEAWGARCNA